MEKINNPCSICLSDIDETELDILECGHFFCIGCIKQVRNPLCPCCRAPIKSKNLTKDDIKNMNVKKHKDKVESERIPGLENIFNDGDREHFQFGHIRVEVIPIPVLNHTITIGRKLIAAYKIMMINESRNNYRTPMDKFILSVSNALKLIIVIDLGNTSGCNELIFDLLYTGLPILYTEETSENITAKLLDIISP